MHLKTILLTRPPGENESLADLLRLEGLSPIVRPLIELIEKSIDPEMKRIALDLDRYDKIIFVSKSSVRFGIPVLENYWPQWPLSLEWFSVGSGTAEALKQAGWSPHFQRWPVARGFWRWLVCRMSPVNRS